MSTDKHKVEERQAKRYRMLRVLYEKTGDHTSGGTYYKEVFAEAGLEEDEGHEILEHLRQKSLLSDRTGVGWLALSHKGIDEMEQSILHPERDTEHFNARVVQRFYAPVGVVQNASESAVSVEQNKITSRRGLNTEQQLVLQRQERRRQVLLRIYDKAEGTVNKHVYYDEIQHAEELSKEDFRAVFDYLKAEGMVNDRYSGGVFEITQFGIETAEGLIRNPQSEPDPALDVEVPSQMVQHYYGPVGAIQNAQNSIAFINQGSRTEDNPLDKNLLDLLVRISGGERFFKPENETDEAKDAFVPVVRRLKELSQRGLIEPLTDRRIIKDHTTGKGHYNIVGPCEITYIGEQAITYHENKVALRGSDTGNKPMDSKYGATDARPQNMPDAIQMRLRDLSDNISKDYALLKEYEDDLRLEDDPRRRTRHQREIDRLKASASEYESEYKELELQLASRSVEASQSEKTKLHQIHVKLDALLAGQSDINLSLYDLRQAILSRYDAGERHIINSIAERLDQSQAETVQEILDAVESNQLNEAEMVEAVSAIHQLLVEVSQHNTPLPKSTELEAAISAPHFDVKHKLKVSIPIVPLVLAYEGEVELGSRMNLERVWNRIVKKFRRE